MNSGIALKTEKQNKGNFKIFYIVAGIIGILLCIQESVTHYAISKYSSRIYPKVWIDDINVGGKWVAKLNFATHYFLHKCIKKYL